MRNNFEQAQQFLEQAQSLLFTTHQRTDGDDLGSVLALALHAKSQGKQVAIAIIGGVPEQLRYLPLSNIVREEVLDQQFDGLVISGCSNLERTGHPQIINCNLPILNLDHHPDNTMYGQVNLVQADKAAVAELVYDLFRFAKWPITAEIATCLLTGIFTDTGSFMHSNTKESTLRAAADLMRKGARPTTVAKHTYKGKSVEGLKAWGKALENTYFDEEKQIIYSILTKEELDNMGNPPLDYFEGIVETLNKVPEAKFALFLKQDGDVIKGSLRSDPHKGIDVKRIAKEFGGGGHTWASGFSVAGRLIKNAAGKWEIQSQGA